MDSTDNPFMRKEEWRKMETEIKLYHEKKKKKKKKFEIKIKIKLIEKHIKK